MSQHPCGGSPGGLVGAISEDVVRSRSSPSCAGTAAGRKIGRSWCRAVHPPRHVREEGSSYPAVLVVSFEMTILGIAASISSSMHDSVIPLGCLGGFR